MRIKRSAFNRLRRNRGDSVFEGYSTSSCSSSPHPQGNSTQFLEVLSLLHRAPLAEIFNTVRKISGKFSPPPVLLNAGEKVGEPETVVNLFASHFVNISRKDRGASRAR